jgi:hypothetical protein
VVSVDPEKLWHNRRSFRVLPSVKRQTHQWNGAGPSDSDSDRRRSFIQSLYFATLVGTKHTQR